MRRKTAAVTAGRSFSSVIVCSAAAAKTAAAMDAVERVCGLLSAVALGGSLGGSAGGSVGVGRAVHAHAIINPE